MFNEKYGLETAVLYSEKSRTWRADKQPRYVVGEIVAMQQSYKDVFFYYLHKNNKKANEISGKYAGRAGWTNKMFVKNELMPHKIRIISVKKCKLQDITDEECMREGIFYYNVGYDNPREAFCRLIDALNGKGYWKSNPDGYAYEFELIK